MKLELVSVTKGPGGRVLGATSATVSSGEAVLVRAETEQRPTVLGLIAAGRMRPDSGEVLVDGSANPRRLRRVCALVDAPVVSEPDAAVFTVGVVTEELMFAGRRANPISARRWMSEHGCSDLSGVPIGQVEPARRIRILCELAASRPGIEALVLVAPDRHGGRPTTWWRVVEDIAATGIAVLVIAGRASWEVLHGPDPEHAMDPDPDPDPDLGPVRETAPEPEPGSPADPDPTPDPDPDPYADPEPRSDA